MKANLLGLRTAAYPVRDLAKAKAWYGRVFDAEPYFDEPFYVGFAIGGFELGLIPAEPGAQPGDSGVLVYWGVADAAAAHARLLGLGAREHGAVKDVGGGILVASVLDPDGNRLGIIQNPHFDPAQAR